ncbi:MAG: DMT family transporter [Rhodospirillales bacterium]|nr:DMT family transporter [Rhodospirillales bacterium]
MNPTMGPREWLLLLALALLWGGSFFFAELALVELRPLTVVLGRVGFAALALWTVLALSGRRLPASPRLWGAFLVMGALNNAIPFSLIVWAQVELDSGLAAILNATTPLFTVLLAHLVTAEERLTWNRVAGVLLGLGGVAVLIGPGALTGLGLAGLAQIAVLAAALSYACAGLYGRRFRGLPPSSAAAGMLTASTVLLLPLALFVERPWTFAPGPSTWAALLGLALLCTALAYLLYFRILASAGATNLLLVTFLIPPGALLLGAMFLGERPEWTAYAGMALIFAGLAAVDGRPIVWLKTLATSRPSAEGAGPP